MRRLKPNRTSTAAAIAALLAAIAIAGCATTTSQPPPIAKDELAAAKSFPYYTTYWVGPSFRHHPVTGADGVASYRPSFGDSIYYGDCLRGKSLLGANGCVLPLQVTTSIYTLHSNSILGSQRNVLIRGVPAVSYEEGRALELYTGRLAIDIFSAGYAEAREAAKLLRPLNHRGSDAGDLPPPVFCPLLYGPETKAVEITMAELPRQACQQAAEALSQKEALEEGQTPEPVS